MQILSVTLKNFKSHRDRHFTFQPGINAICGENGAGKTSILEAIAWTLFNYRGVYRNEDLICNDASTAQVTVEFISNRDQRTYLVKRCTRDGYTIFDPQINQSLEYKRIEDEVLPWLREHLGVAPGTDLGRLFANTIGVPQGTFTADFLQTAERRKEVFDRILKVEEYKQTNQKMLSLEKFAKGKIEGLQQAIAQYEDALQQWEPLQAQQQQITDDITQAETQLTRLNARLTELEATKNSLSAQAQQVQTLENQIKTGDAQLDGKRQAIALLEQSVQRAAEAVERCNTHREGYEQYLKAERSLRALEERTKQQRQLQKQRDTQQKLLATKQADVTRITVELDRLAQLKTELAQLQPRVQQQQELETEQTELTHRLQALQASVLEKDKLDQHLQRLRQQWRQLSQEIEQIQTLRQQVAAIPDLEQQRDRLQQQLSRLAAATQFEAELHQLVSNSTDQRDRYQVQATQALATLEEIQAAVPLLATDAIATVRDSIQAGVDLTGEMLNTLRQILADLGEQVSETKLKTQLKAVQSQLEQAYRDRAIADSLDAKETQKAELQQDGEQTRQRIADLETQIQQQDKLRTRLSDLTTQLQALENPKGRAQLLEQQQQQIPKLEAERNRLKASYADLEKEVEDLTQQLQAFEDLEADIEQQTQLRQQHQSSYQTYLQFHNDAEQYATVQANLNIAHVELERLERDRQTLQKDYDALLKTYDPQEWQRIETLYTDTRRQADQLAGGLPQQRKLLESIDFQLRTLQDTAEKRDRTQADLKEQERVKRFISFARKVYKEAGPRITEQYVQAISKEADKLFRELLNRQNVALEWTRDYEILVQEGAHTRRFANLSGGEQMCAALAVRLALLKVLADIDVAFFDEPTTNMDKPRRQSLAEAIANIKSFRQLFVISHDDTFEQVTENIILVEREMLG